MQHIFEDENRLQQKTRLVEIQLQIHGFNKRLVSNDRVFVYNRTCQMKRRGLPGKKYKQIQIYLFNDLLIWVSSRGKFKGSYSFYQQDLEICLPPNHKKGDACFSIGLTSEKHKRLIVCADDLQRDKLMNTMDKTYKQCQAKYVEAMNGNNEEAIQAMKRRQMRDTNGHDIDFSASSMDTRNTYNNEYSVSQSETNDFHANHHHHGGGSRYNASPLKPMSSVSVSGNMSDSQRSQTGSQLGKISESKEYVKNERIDNKWNRRQTNHLKGPMNVDPRFANHEHDLSASNQTAESFKIPLIIDQSPNGSLNGSAAIPSIDIDSSIIPFKQDPSTITPEPSIIMSSDEGSAREGSVNSQLSYRRNGHNKKHRKRKHNEHHKSKRDKIKELQQTVHMKDSRIKDLEQINQEIRRTLQLKDTKIEALQSEVDAMKIKLSRTKIRAKSAVFRPRRSRIKRASSFSIDSGGNVTRTALLPSQFDHNNKLIKTSLLNGPKTSVNLSTPKVPSSSLRRSHSSGANGYHRKVQSLKYFVAIK